MGLWGHHLLDDVDVDSFLANVHRLDALGPPRVVDLRPAQEAAKMLVLPDTVGRALGTP